MKEKPRILVFASGKKDGGGSGFEKMVEATRCDPPKLDAEIGAVVSNHEWGGVRERADRLKIPFHLLKVFDAEAYRALVSLYKASWVMLSGWLKKVSGLNPARTINIHPGPLPRFGGDGMHGHAVHEAVLASFHRGEITNSAVTMHFVLDDDQYDTGPSFFVHEVPICNGDTPKILGDRVNLEEHRYQPLVLHHVVHGHVRLMDDGRVVYGSRDLLEMMLPRVFRDENHIVYNRPGSY